MKPKSLVILFSLLPCLAFAGGIDDRINADLSRRGITPSVQSDPARLVRRYYLVTTDRLPTESQVRQFIARPDKVALVDSLLASDGFVRKQVLKWGDLFRIKSEFPSCMWPNAVQAFNKWMTEEFRANTPYNEFIAKILTSTGSNFRVPQTNFFRAGSDRSPAKFTSDIALIFLGRRQSPSGWEPFFSQIKFKGTKEWKEEILCLDIDAEPLQAELGGRTVVLQEGTDYRIPFVKWLTASDNRELARAFANRLWFWLTGTGIISPVDDIEGRTPTCQALLDYLTDSFIASGFDVRRLAREILLSDAFSRSTITNATNAGDNTGFSHYIQTRLTSEQICDGLCDITGVFDKYSSRAPEPFTNFPISTHANEVCDGTITTTQLDIFGRPSRDVALESARDNSVNAKQILYLLNSTDIQEKLRTSPVLAKLSGISDTGEMINAIYLRVLARPATKEEVSAVNRWAASCGAGRRKLAESLTWALINTDEFLFMN